MVIAVNARLVVKNNLEGYGHFIYESFRRIIKTHTDHNFLFIFDKPFDPSFTFPGNVTPVVVQRKPGGSVTWWLNTKVSFVLKKYKADVFVSAGELCTLFTSVPQCLIINDINFLYQPKLYSKKVLALHKRHTASFLKKAKQVIAGSDSAKQNIISNYKVPGIKVRVLSSGVDDIFKPVDFEVREKIKDTYAEGHEYFLFTGEIDPVSNLLNLLKAFSFFKKRQKSTMHVLIAGRPGWKYEEFTASLKLFKYRNAVKLLKEVNESELPDIIASAYCVVHPVYSDVFTSAPLAAMKSAVPVIASNIESIAEVCNDAVLYFDPADHKDIADKMMIVFKDENLRNQLIEKGQRHVQKFNWDITSVMLWESIIRTTA